MEFRWLNPQVLTWLQVSGAPRYIKVKRRTALYASTRVLHCSTGLIWQLVVSLGYQTCYN